MKKQHHIFVLNISKLKNVGTTISESIQHTNVSISYYTNVRMLFLKY